MQENDMNIAAEIEHFIFEPEGEDLPDFIVLEFSGHEGISQLTHFDIRLLARDQEIDFEAILNKKASLRIWSWEDDDYARVYHGIISSFQQIGQSEGYASYHATLVPCLWRLTLNYQSRIFQEISVPNVIGQVLSDAEFQSGSDYRLALEGDYQPLTDPPREFCVQYRETDFNFISRLMEEEGIFYFFEYGNSREVMVIADNPRAHPNTSPMGEIPYEVPSRLQNPEQEYIYPLYYRVNVIPTDFMLRDFNYDTPQTDLTSSLMTFPETQAGGFTYYDYPGHYGFSDRGTALTSIRYEEREAERRILSGRSNCRSLCACHVFELSGHHRADLNDESYLLTRIRHHGVQGGPLATDVETSYNNEFECVPAPTSDLPYRPPRVTPKPRVQGTQTATVVGPPGEELYMDEKGRAKVEFHWDLRDQDDENSSCWIRVSHGYAGPNHGIQFHPLVGDEVIVDFLEGDPDKPIIIGRVYNAQNMPPLKPEDRIQNIILTPYQHRLLLADNDKSITLNTGGNEKIEMVDTMKRYGNAIRISTADEHYVLLAKGSAVDGIAIQTVNGNVIRLDDERRSIGIMTTDRHRITLRDEEAQIQIETAGGHLIKLDDPSGTITISGTGTVAITAGTVAVSATTVTIDATDIKAKAKGNITFEAAGNIEMKAGGKFIADAPEVEITGREITTLAAVNKVLGATVEITGMIVKINS